MKNLVGLFLAGCALAANGQDVIALGAGNCNVAQTICSVPNNAGDTVTFVYNARDGSVTLVVTTVKPDLTTTTVTYRGLMRAGASTNTNFVVVTPFSADLSPAAELHGNLRKTRSGSGRAGWTWHTHWEFQTLAIH